MAGEKEKKRRRGHNEGSIYRRADGKWVAAVSLGIQDGKFKRKCKVADTRKEVSDWLKPELAKAQQGGLIVTKRERSRSSFNAGYQNAPSYRLSLGRMPAMSIR